MLKYSERIPIQINIYLLNLTAIKMIKKAVIKTLLDRAKTIPSTSTLQTEEIQNVLRALKLNGYKKSFIKEVVNDTVKVNQKGKKIYVLRHVFHM